MYIHVQLSEKMRGSQMEGLISSKQLSEAWEISGAQKPD